MLLLRPRLCLFLIFLSISAHAGDGFPRRELAGRVLCALGATSVITERAIAAPEPRDPWETIALPANFDDAHSALNWTVVNLLVRLQLGPGRIASRDVEWVEQTLRWAIWARIQDQARLVANAGRTFDLTINEPFALPGDRVIWIRAQFRIDADEAFIDTDRDREGRTKALDRQIRKITFTDAMRTKGVRYRVSG